MYINTPFGSSRDLRHLGAPKKIIDYIANHHGYDESHKMIIAKVHGRDAYRLFAAVGNQWMDASLQDLDPDIAAIADASLTGASLGKRTSAAKKKSSAANGKLGGRPKKN
jgi:hypothetical protein